MTSHKNLIIGFISIMLLTTILGFTSIYKMLGLSEITEKMYKHPFSVSKAILQIKIQTTNIELLMKDIVRAKELSEVRLIVKTIDKNHLIAEDNYKLIFERYLGNMDDIKQSHNMFVKWEEHREKIIANIVEYDFQNLDTNKHQEALHSKKLDALLNKLENFAANKAISYNNMARDTKVESIVIITVLFILIALISATIAIIVIKNSIKATQDIQRYFHLIEQNVNIAHLNRDTSINEASHSLSRLLKTTKEKLASTKENPLLGIDEHQKTEILKTIRSSKQWQGEIEVMLEDLKNIWLDVDIQPQLDNNFDITGYTMIIDDITSKKLLEVVSITDGMTGLFNRREFDLSFNKRLDLVRREKKTLVFMMLDIDHFKLYNDNYGHQDGDTTLKNVARALKNTFSRPDDTVYRLGGEEFGVLFSTNNADGAKEMSQRVLDNIKKLNITHSFSSTSDRITVSIGTGIVVNSQTSTDNIYAEVDSALYRAKEDGRDRYEVVSI